MERETLELMIGGFAIVSFCYWLLRAWHAESISSDTEDL
jgi:hypothetical protein